MEKPKIQFNTGPFKNVIVLGHSSVEERDAEAGEVGLTLRDADISDLWRGGTDEMYTKWIPTAEAETGMKRAIDAEKTAKANVGLKEGNKPKEVKESQTTYADRVKASVSEDVWKELDAKFREIALASPIDASPSARAGRASQANLTKADEILSRSADKIEASVERMLTEYGPFDLTRDETGKPERTSLARLYGTWLNDQMEKMEKRA